MIQDNIAKVQDDIKAACNKAGRATEEVTLITVSKTKPISLLKEAYDAGSRDFGENKLQQMLDKIPEMPSDVRWHMIGHLQRNKVKYIVDKVYLIHSVDSVRLAEEISKEAIKKQVEVDILIEVNVALEESKFGTTTEEAVALVDEISKLPGIHIKGLMTIAPFVEEEEENRLIFRKLKQNRFRWLCLLPRELFTPELLMRFISEASENFRPRPRQFSAISTRFRQFFFLRFSLTKN